MSSPLPSNADASQDDAADTAGSHLYPSMGERAVSPWELLRTLWNGKWLICALALLFAGGSYLYWEQQPKTYRTSSILLLKEAQQFDRLELSLPVDKNNHTGRDLYFLRHSQVFAQKVAARLADSARSRAPDPHTALHDWTTLSPGQAEALRNRVRIRRGSREVPAIKISVTSTHPAEASLITSTYAQAYLDHLRASSNARLRTSRQFLTRQKERLRERLRAVEDTIAAYVREQGRAGLLGTADSTAGAGVVGEARQIASEISDLRVQKEKVQLELNIENAMLDSAKARLKRIRPQLAERASSTTANRLKQTQENIASLQTQIQQVALKNESLEPDLQSELDRMKSRVKELREKSKRLADRYVRRALSADAVQPLGEGGGGLSTVVDLQRQITEHRITITKLRARRSALSDRIESRQAALRTSPDQTLARLKRRKNTTEELFVALSKSLQKVQVSSKSTPPQAQILQQAQPPGYPIGPDVKRNVILALVFGGVLGGGIVLLYARMDNRIEAPDDIEKHGPGLFGVIPSWTAEAPFIEERPPGEPSPPSRPWSGVAAPCSSAAEAYRHVTTNLQLGIPESLDLLLVTSAYPKEGKSTTTANLGVTLSEAGLDVLVVDADAYGASLHRAFGTERAPGLTDRLADTDQGVRTLLAPTDEEAALSGDGAPGVASSLETAPGAQMGRLGLLPSGSTVPQPSLLFQEPHLRSLFETLGTEWDLLLLDSPPILTYDAASRMAALSDMVLLLADAGETKEEGFAEAVSRASTLCSGPVAGVLNRYDASSTDVYGYEHSTYASAVQQASLGEQVLRRTKRGFRRLATGN
jgi:tyrosine-protein kinase Etk/Wzc